MHSNSEAWGVPSGKSSCIRSVRILGPVLGLAFWLSLSPLTHAQIKTGRLDGDVQDATGASVAGAAITAVETQRQATSSVKSSNDGHFTFPSLSPGTYSLTIEAPGFRKSVLTGVAVTVADTVNEIVKLEVGSVSDSITVEANSATVQTTDSSISSAISMKEVDLLPQINRTPITLAIFQPGVQIDIRAGQDSSFSHVNGLRQGSNNSTLDGIDVNDSLVPRLGLTLTSNNSDSVEEFRGVTAGGSAQFGRSAGEQISLITRSGTNGYHGNAYEYLRNTDLNANDFFNNQAGTPTPKYIRNLFGGSFGGPIIHNKLFIFGNYQGTRTKQDTIRTRTVPTASALQGIFKYRTSSGAIQQLNISSFDPLGIGIDPAVAKLFSLYPAPNTNSVGDGLNTTGYTFNNPTPSLEDQFTIKGDYRPTDKHAIFLRWSWQRNTAIDSLNNADATFPGQPQGSQGGHRWGFAAGHTWTVSPTLINEVIGGYQSSTVDFLRPGRPNGPALQTTGLFSDIPYTSFTQGRNSPVIDFVDNLSKVLGNHTLKVGTNVRSTKQYGYNYSGAFPTLLTTVAAGGSSIPSPAGLTSNQLTVFQQLYNDLLGRITQINQTYYSSDLSTLQPAGSPRVRNFRLNESGYYLQDDWHATKRLTLNIGLRYEFFGQPHEINGIQGVANLAGIINGIDQTAGITIQKGDRYYGRDWNNFAPRFGFAFDPTGDGKSAIRGFYGIYFDRAVGATINGIDGSTPGFATATNTFPDASGADIRFTSNPAPVAPAGPTVTPPLNRNTTLFLANPNLRTGYVQSFGFNVQRQLPAQFLITAGYVGTRGVKLFMDRDVNQPRVSSDFQSSFNELAQYVNNRNSPVSPNNFFVKVFGSAANAVTAVTATNLTQGRVGTVINTIDRTASNIIRMTNAGYSPFYFRNYPQFNQVVLGTNDGRSAFDSLQVSLRRATKSLNFSVNYTWSKSIDNVSNEGNGFTGVGSGIPIDSYNLRLNRALSDYDRPHSVNSTAVYSIPIGQGRTYFGHMPRWADSLLGGWDIGSLIILQSGNPFSVSSQRATSPVSGVNNTYANYNGTDVSIGGVNKLGDGVYFFTPAQVAQFVYPGAFQIGNAGRNIFRNPAFYEVDASLSKRFKITERQSVSLRGEAYNLFNHPNFGLSSTNLNINTPTTFGKFSSTLGTQVGGSSARLLQVSARYEF